MLKHFSIRNYKSLHNVKIDLPQFFVVVGANAAGKTNLVDAVEFLATVAQSGLASALNEKGGYENICFRRQRRSKGAIHLTCTISNVNVAGLEFQLTLSFSFRALRSAIRSSYSVLTEEIELDVIRQGQIDPYLRIKRNGQSVKYETLQQPSSTRFHFAPQFLEELFAKDKLFLREDDLLIWTYLRGLPPFSQILGELAKYRVFQIAPGSARKPGAASGNQELGKYGENLPAALEWLKREHSDLHNQLMNYARLAVPTIEKVETDYVETRELGLFLKESGMQRRMFASELSDGTLKTLAMFLPLVDPRLKLVVIEEPENSIHPWVVRHFVEACRNCSANKQIVLTTHSPVLVSRLQPAELYVAEREQGETKVYSAQASCVELEGIIQEGIQDLGTYWDSGAMKAVPKQPEFEFMR